MFIKILYNYSKIGDYVTKGGTRAISVAILSTLKTETVFQYESHIILFFCHVYAFIDHSKENARINLLYNQTIPARKQFHGRNVILSWYKQVDNLSVTFEALM